ncbi:glycosyltransferase family 25 protein [Mesorhizobium sp. ES1-1]|uniref:glycosyltransferase family 25 protein n=1 Tax=Mesorhizobium sp. ES1-1 TaxID=2876629 RepID=UPI0021E259A5|nr:glycosyltransferase family 25 protein [Mesorhizobium sp. ES1-1]
MTPGEIGCFLSHQACWQRIVDGDEQFGAVFEDDVIFSEHLATFLNDANWVPADADLVKLETVKAAVWLGASKALSDGYEITRMHSLHCGSGAYIISQSAARQFLVATRRFVDGVDHALFNPACGACVGVRTYQVFPALCIQAQVLYRNAHALRGDLALTAHSEPRYRDSLAHLPWLKRKARSAARRIAHIARGHRRIVVPFVK